MHAKMSGTSPSVKNFHAKVNMVTLRIRSQSLLKDGAMVDYVP